MTEAVDLPSRGERLEPGWYELRLTVERNEIDGRDVIIAGDVTNAEQPRYLPLLQEDVDTLARDKRVKVQG